MQRLPESIPPFTPRGVPSGNLIGNIYVYNATSSIGGPYPFPIVAHYKAPNCTMVDDFSILYKDANGVPTPSIPHMFAADYAKGNIVVFRADGTGVGTVIASGVTSPTSVRIGSGPGWNNPNSVFVSEGGGVLPSQNTQRVWELHLG